MSTIYFLFFFFFNDTATTEISTFPYTTLFRSRWVGPATILVNNAGMVEPLAPLARSDPVLWLRNIGVNRSEEHTSELQSRSDLVCRLLLEKKKTSTTKTRKYSTHYSSE